MFNLLGITFPSGEIQKRLLTEVYQEAGIDPKDVAYVEAHGTGTKAGDPQELNSITDVFCKGREGPLLIGSTKSNMGHPEPASGKSSNNLLDRMFKSLAPNLNIDLISCKENRILVQC